MLKIDSRYRILVLVLILLLVPQAQAGVLDQIKRAYEAIEEKVNASRNSEEAGAASEEGTQAEPNQSGEGTAGGGTGLRFAQHWQKDRVQEPVFGDELFILQAGLEHGQTVLLIHGLGQRGARDWVNVIPELENKYHVLAVDLPGFGNSANPPGRYSPTNYARLMNWVVSNYAKGKVFAVGHSMGAAVALRFASEYPGQVSKLVLVDTAGILQRTAFLKHAVRIQIPLQNSSQAARALGSDVVDLADSIVEMLTRIPDPAPILNQSEEAWNSTFADRPNVNAAMALIEENFSRAIKGLPHETTIIWGRNDPIAPLRTGIVLAGRLPNAKLEIIDEAGHVQMNSPPRLFNPLLAQALTAETELEKATAESSGREPVVQARKLVCKNEKGKIYSGHFTSIVIKKCAGIKLENVTAAKIYVEDSVIEMVNTHVVAKRVAIKAVESVIEATSSSFSGRVGMLSDGSRLDLAGGSVSGGKTAIKVKANSRFVMSVSDLSSPIYQDFVHGVFELKKASLEEVLNQELELAKR